MASVFLILLPLAAFAGNCNNPLFAAPFPLDGVSVPMNLLASPQTQGALSSCTAFNNKQSCCVQQTFDEFNDYYQGFDANVDFVLSIIDDVDAETLARILMQVEGWNFNTIQEGALINLLDLLLPMIETALVCQGGMMGYQQGMICFACDPDWAKYYSPQALTLNVSSSTCNSVWGECKPIMNDINRVAVQALGYIITIFNNTADPDTHFVNDLVAFQALVKASGSVCPALGFKDCQSLICDGSLHGLEIGLNFSAMGVPSQKSAYSLQSVNSEKTPEVEALQKALSFLKPKEKSFFPSRTLLQTTTTVTNNYPTSAPTYNAYGVGCDSPMSRYACPDPIDTGSSDSPSAGWIVAVTFGCLLGVGVLAAAVYLAVKFRGRGPSSLQDHREPLAVVPPSDLDYLPPSAPEPRESRTSTEQ